MRGTERDACRVDSRVRVLQTPRPPSCNLLRLQSIRGHLPTRLSITRAPNVPIPMSTTFPAYWGGVQPVGALLWLQIQELEVGRDVIALVIVSRSGAHVESTFLATIHVPDDISCVRCTRQKDARHADIHAEQADIQGRIGICAARGAIDRHDVP